MPVGESLRWQPELTKPPLYQFAVRGVSRFSEFKGSRVQGFKSEGVPREWQLRLPAAVCGVLSVAAMWWMGSLAGGWTLGAAAALLFAVNSLQIEYSQEARPYSMLTFGSIVSTAIWYRLVTRQQGSEAREEFRNRRVWWFAIAYILVTALTFHANYLMALTVSTHAIWAAVSLISIENRKSKIDNLKVLTATMFATSAACVPIVWHFLRHRTSVFQGLDWIAAPTVGSALKVLGEVTFGWIWLAGLLAAAVLSLLGYSMAQIENRKSKIEDRSQITTLPYCEITKPPHHQITTSPYRSFCGLLLVWLAVAWGGLLLISWVAHPAMVARYALPAAAPAILLPLIVLHRMDRRLPLVLAGVFVVGTAPAWATRTDRVKLGFREMVQFLDEYADPLREAVVVVIERTTSPGWEEMDLLGFEYYGSSKFEIRNSKKGNEATRQQGSGKIKTLPHYDITTLPHSSIEVLYLLNGRPDGDQPILHDPRALWMVTFLADPMEAIGSAERRIEQIEIEGNVFEQLYFEPYRLIRVAEMN